MRHLIAKNTRRGKIGATIAVASLVLAIGAFAQQSVVPPPPPDSQQASQPAQIEPPPEANNVRAVRLSDVEGKVQIFNGADPAFNQAQVNMPVVEGMRLVTAEDGRVEIQFEDGSVARITPNSSLTLAQLHRSPDGSTITTIDASTGLTYYELNGRSGQYSVRFGPNTVTPTDSAIFRVNLDGNPADLAVTHGTVHVSDGQNLAVDVRTNHSIRFDTQTPGQYQLVQSVAADTWDQWNSDRDQALATLEENATTARASTGNPDDPGWSDLDYYGDWYNVPGYGMAWSPSGVGSGWDPFGVGAWGYYSGIGYTWISGYSWGWWPYHCGAWSWFDSFGWMWFPGNCGFGFTGVGWYPYASVWRCPPNYRPPLRPTVPGTHGLPSHNRILHVEPLIAVNRGSFDQQFRLLGGVKPTPRVFDYDGRTIAPAESTIRVRTGGPIGEGFTTAVLRTHPEELDYNTVRAANPGRSVYQSGGHVPAGSAPPPPTYRPAPSPAPPRNSYSSSGGVHVAAPPPSGGGVHVSAPSAPAAGGGHPR
jgi:FecR protein